MPDFSAGASALALIGQANAIKDQAALNNYGFGANIGRIGERLFALGQALDERKNRDFAKKQYEDSLELQKEQARLRGLIDKENLRSIRLKNNMDEDFFDTLLKTKMDAKPLPSVPLKK